MKTLLVYNLEFPTYIDELNIRGYRFYRVDKYRDRIASLQHRVGFHSEFSLNRNPGVHAITANVDVPDHEHAASLDWGGTATELSDILLLLSIFTGRDVFIDNRDGDMILFKDPRLYVGGGILRASIPYEENEREGNVGFAKEMNRVYDLIKTDEWKKTYHGGYFLILAQSAFYTQPLNSIFTQCWTIWEHLFAILNISWMSEDRIRGIESSEKISFLLTRHALRSDIDNHSRKKIQELAQIRNRLIHFGKFPTKTQEELDDVYLFVNLTEFIIAKILGMIPSNVLNTMDRLEKYFQQQKGQLQKPSNKTKKEALRTK